ncbi:MAG: hypothetical protein ACRETM_05955 [Stenotrophobium sp.]
MIRRYGIYAALFAVLLQVFTPALAALSPAKPMQMDMAMMSMHEPCAHDDGAGAAAMHMTTTPHGDHGCCCHGLWSCGGPCGAAAIIATAPALPLLTPSIIWNAVTSPSVPARSPSHLLRPPIAA